MDEKTMLVVQKILDLQLELAILIEAVSFDTIPKPRTIDQIKTLKERIGRIRDIVGRK